MSNRMLTIKEVCDEIFGDMQKECGDDIKKQRAWVYDIQTAFGGFPASEEQRQRYIETGKP